MYLLSVDIETTGLNPRTCSIIQIGMVLDNTEWWDDGKSVEALPQMSQIIRPQSLDDFGEVRGEPFALAMNANLLKMVDKGIREEQVMDVVADWLVKEATILTCPYSITAVGKNFGSFDLQFIKKLNRYGSRLAFKHRILDPGSLYFNPLTDTELPNLSECKKRVGLSGDVAHDALADARDVLRVVRAFYGKKG